MATHAKIDAVLAALQAHADDHFNVDPDEVNWGHAGNLGHVLASLREVAAFCGVALDVR